MHSSEICFKIAEACLASVKGVGGEGAHISATCSATHPSLIIKFCQPMGRETRQGGEEEQPHQQRQEAAVKGDGDAH